MVCDRICFPLDKAARFAAAALCTLFAACGVVRVAWGQAEPPDVEMVFARKGSGSPVTEGHGWFVTRDAAGGPSSREVSRIVLEHLPPRSGDAGDLSGVVRRVFSMEVAGKERGSEGGVWSVSGGGIDGLAWKRNRVYMLMPEERVSLGATTGLGRRVLMVSAVHAAGTMYEYSPSGRGAARAALPSPAGGSVVVGFAALPGLPPHDGVCALVVPTMGSAAGDLRRTELWMMTGEEWTRTNAPWETPATGVGEGWTVPPLWRSMVDDDGRWQLEPGNPGGVQLIEWRDGVGVAMADHKGEMLDVWVGVPTAKKPESAGGPVMEWRPERYSLQGPGVPGGRARLPMRLAFVAGKVPSADLLIGWTHSDNARSARGLVALRPTGAVQIASLTGVPASADMIPMAAPDDGVNLAGSVAMVWGIKSPERADRTVVREYSAATGLLLYDGSARVDEFEDRRRMQFAGIVVVLGMVGMLVVAFRSRISAGVTRAAGGVLPAGSGGRGSGRIRAAAPVRRLAATVLDYAPCAVIVALAQGRDAMALLTPSTMFGGAAGLSADLDLGPFAIALGLAVLHTTILEWAFGRSIGKFILGVRVVDGRRSGGGEGETGGVFVRPMLWQTFLRNLIRWCAPLLAVFALLDEVGRHPGDLAGQTLVVADPNDGS